MEEFRNANRSGPTRASLRTRAVRVYRAEARASRGVSWCFPAVLHEIVDTSINIWCRLLIFVYPVSSPRLLCTAGARTELSGSSPVGIPKMPRKSTTAFQIVIAASLLPGSVWGQPGAAQAIPVRVP